MTVAGAAASSGGRRGGRAGGGGAYSNIPDAEEVPDNPFAAKPRPRPSARAARGKGGGGGGYRDADSEDESASGSGEDDPYWDGEERETLESGQGGGGDRKPPGILRNSNGRGVRFDGSAAMRAGGATSVYVDDDSMNSSDDPYGEMRRRRRQRLLRGGNDPLRGFWMYAALVLLVVALVLIGYQKERREEASQRSHHGGNGNQRPHGNKHPGVATEGMPRPNPYDDDGDDDDDTNDDDEYGDAGGLGISGKAGAAAGAGSVSVSAAQPKVTSTPALSYGAVHHRDPLAAARASDPFHLSDSSHYGSVFAPPPFPAYGEGDEGGGGEEFDTGRNLGYAQYPDVHNNTVVFTSEGDLYLSSLPPGALDATGETSGKAKLPPLPSMKLTTTVGNVLTPKINPRYPYLVAFTATYTGVREAYLMDLRPHRRSLPSVRLTYFDAAYGCEKVVGWEDDGRTLVVAAGNDRVGMEDSRLYRIGIVRPGSGGEASSVGDDGDDDGLRHAARAVGGVAVAGVEPVPLSQATESSTDPASGCVYFTRYRQSSNTARYVGGTAESLWGWCPRQPRAVKLTGDYRGTSKSPGLYTVGGGGDGNGKEGTTTYLLFLSDRAENYGSSAGGETPLAAHKRNYGLYKAVNNLWRPGSMDLWAIPLPSEKSLYGSESVGSDWDFETLPVRLTSISCRFDGMPLSEYAVDGGTGNVVLRIGADLHLMRREEVEAKLAAGDGRERRGLAATTTKKKKKKTTTKKKAPVEKKEDADEKGTKKEAEPAKVVKATEEEAEKEGEDSDTAMAAAEKEDVDEEEESGKEGKGKDVGEGKKKTAPLKPKAKATVTKAASTPSKVDSAPSLSSSSPSASSSLIHLPLVIYSDFHEMHERLLIPSIPDSIQSTDVFPNPYGGLSVLHTLRGQTFVNPVLPDAKFAYQFGGGGMNIPPRRYRLAPGAATGGMVRILTSKVIPDPEELVGPRRRVLLLATDPLSPTAEMAFYVVDAVPGTGDFDVPAFADVENLPEPLIGGHRNGGSAKEGGLGSVRADTVSVSPCGRRIAWTDTDGRIAVVAIPPLAAATAGAGSNVTASEDGGSGGPRRRLEGDEQEHEGAAQMTILPRENESGEPMIGTNVDELSWSPGGRYLAVEHSARNQFGVITVVDCGDPSSDHGDSGEGSGGGGIKIGRAVQATPDRFNSVGAYWGRTALDMKLDTAEKAAEKAVYEALGITPPPDKAGPPPATTLYFLSDRDVVLSGVRSPWGTRAPSPHFERRMNLHALPLLGGGDNGDIEAGESEEEETEGDPLREVFAAPYMGGGAAEVLYMREAAFKAKEEEEAMEALAMNRTGAEEAGEDAPDDDGTSGGRRAAARRAGEDDDAESSSVPSSSPTEVPEPLSPYPTDNVISFGRPAGDGASDRFPFARRSYRVSNVPTANYLAVLSQLLDDASLLLVEMGDDKMGHLKIFSVGEFPSDSLEALPIEVPGATIEGFGLSTSREYLHLTYGSLKGSGAVIKAIPNTGEGVVSLLLKDLEEFGRNVVDTERWSLSIQPALEYRQMYADAWRLLRDYFYDADMTNIDWPAVFRRYLPLVRRCAKREELDDVLRHMASELSALHVFVYGGEYGDPTHGSAEAKEANQVASLGATLRRSEEWAGYEVVEVPERDPDFGVADGKAIYSPLSDRTLRLSGQRGLKPGDVILGVNGESAANVPALGMLLRGMAGRSVRLDVLRVASGPSFPVSAAASSRRAKKWRRRAEEADASGERDDEGGDGDGAGIVPEPLIAVPLSPRDAAHLRYSAWEWKTRQRAKRLAAESNFTVGYIHLRDMSGADAEDAFVRGFYPDYDKDAIVVDVRHNHGGNIDSWLLDVLQRRPWMYWKARATNITTGGLGWDEQFAFRGHLVVLTDEKTSSDGEGFSRGVSELGLGRLVGTRTWGGGIWLASDNRLVDGGIASAPEIGTYNDKLGWGLGIEQMGVEPDVEVDNDPRETFDGRDEQLERAVRVLGEWLEEEPVVLPKDPGPHRDMSYRQECKAGQ